MDNDADQEQLGRTDVVTLKTELPADTQASPVATYGGATAELRARITVRSEPPWIEDFSVQFIALRCQGEEVPLGASAPCKFCLAESTFDVCIRIVFPSIRPFSSFYPRILGAEGLHADTPTFAPQDS